MKREMEEEGGKSEVGGEKERRSQAWAECKAWRLAALASRALACSHGLGA